MGKAASRTADWLDRSPLRGRRRITVSVLLSILAVGLVVVGTVGFLGARHNGAIIGARTAALAAAVPATERLLTYNYSTIDQQIDAVDDVTTGEFKDQFRTALSQLVKPNAVQQEASSNAKVMASGVVSASPDRVVVLLYLNQTTTAAPLPGPRVDAIQARVTMDKVGANWLMAGLDQV